MNSKLFFRYATMNSAKSAELLMKAYNFEERGLKILCIKPSIDDREGKNVIKSRVGIERECKMVKPTDNIYDGVKKLLENGGKIDWILADESQFFKKEQIDQLGDIVDELEINVICYGLRADFRTELFEGSKRLFEIADSIEEMKSSCSCGRKSIINARIDENGNVVTNGEQIEIGGNDRYVSLCRKCYKKLRN
jgi:thymidine kinase